jgi:pSer/pThr/pTyr-binding forkhead associated (FHA) protein
MADPPSVPPSPAELEQEREAVLRGSPFVVFRDAGGHQRVVELGEGGRRLTVGRGSATDFWLDWDPNVSRVHAELEHLGDCWTVVDDGLSRNGSFVNEERVEGRRRLADGDRLRFGSTTMIYRAPLESPARATKA